MEEKYAAALEIIQDMVDDDSVDTETIRQNLQTLIHEINDRLFALPND